MWGLPPSAVHRLEESTGVDLPRQRATICINSCSLSRAQPGRTAEGGRPHISTGTESLELTAESYASALLACVARLANPDGSLTARSARILRSSSIFATFNPWMNWL